MKIEFTKGTGLNASLLESKDLDGILDLVYPVGSVYISAANTSPSTLFGGTWEQIKDKFLLSAGDTHTAGSIGGEESTTLSAAEMPVHKHDVSVTNSGAGTTGSVADHSHGTYYKNDNTIGGSGRRAGNSSDNDGISAGTAPSGGHSHSTPNHSHTISESNKGSGAPHNNMPPYLAVYVWKRTA
jgi:microcystin-dependent protein